MSEHMWPPRIGGTIHIGTGRWRIAAFGIKDGERWVMCIRRGVVNLIPWDCVAGGLGYS